MVSKVGGWYLEENVPWPRWQREFCRMNICDKLERWLWMVRWQKGNLRCERPRVVGMDGAERMERDSEQCQEGISWIILERKDWDVLLETQEL